MTGGVLRGHHTATWGITHHVAAHSDMVCHVATHSKAPTQCDPCFNSLYACLMNDDVCGYVHVPPPPPPPTPVFPASYNQKTLYDLQQTQPTCPDYNVFQGLRYISLDPASPVVDTTWPKALSLIAMRQAVFRTLYKSLSHKLYQVVLELSEFPLPFEYVDLAKKYPVR